MTGTLDPGTVAGIVDALERARRTKEQIRQLTLDHPHMTMEDAYAVQRAWIDRRLAEGRETVGHKIGLTSRAMQKSVGIDEPDFGSLLDDMVYDAAAPIPTSDFVEPRLEVELAFVLAAPLTPDVDSIDAVYAATEYIVPAVEIIDARVQRVDPETGRTRTVRDTIADNAANAGIVIGERHVLPGEVDLRWAGGLLTQNGVIEETGLGAGVLGHPARGIVWLAQRFGRYLDLHPGQIILAGSFTRPVFVAPGDEFIVDYGPLGTIEFGFA